jgi:hypothetical protein
MVSVICPQGVTTGSGFFCSHAASIRRAVRRAMRCFTAAKVQRKMKIKEGIRKIIRNFAGRTWY